MATWTPSMEDVFGILSDKMQSYFERTKKSVERPDEKGAPREEIVLEFFKDFMPSSIGVEKGYAINLNGDHSRECDIIFYRKNTSPIFKISPTSNLYIIPIEDIYGAIEVKSSLTQTQIKNCLLKKNSLKSCFERRNVDEEEHYDLPQREDIFEESISEPFFAVFCYSIQHSGKDRIKDFYIHLHDQSRFDAVYCLDEASYVLKNDLTISRHNSLNRGITNDASASSSSTLDEIVSRACMIDFYARSYSDYIIDNVKNGELLMFMYAYINDYIESANLQKYSTSDYIALWKNKQKS